MCGARAASSPALRGAPHPPLLVSLRMYLTRGSPIRASTRTVSSVLASSTTITSRLCRDWFSTEVMARDSRAESLNVMSTTLTSGCMLHPPSRH